MEPVGVTVVDPDGRAHHARWRDAAELRCGPWTILARRGAASPVAAAPVHWALAAAGRRPAGRVVLHLRGAPAPTGVVHREGWQSWSATGPRLERRPAGCPPWAARSLDGGVARPAGASDAVAVVGTRDGALAVGFLSARRHFGWVSWGGTGGAVRCTASLEGVMVAREPLRLDPVGWFAGPTPGAALAAYADAVGRRNRARAAGPAVTGWCSWTAHGPDLTAARVKDTVARLAGWRDLLRVIQVDDGYQAATGDWLTTRPEVGAPLAGLIETIAGAGFVAGLWAAPFAAGRGSRVARDHPTWLLRDTQGVPVVCMPWMDEAAALDCSQPEVREHLRATFATIRGLGVSYLKADFGFAAAAAGHHKEAGWTRAAALAAGLDAVRAGVGDEAHLLICGCPWLTAVGVADSFRVAADVTRRWRPRWDATVPVPRGASAPAAGNAAVGSLRRAWMHRRLWVNDPDCLLRTDTTAPVREALTAVAAAAGGTVILSDPAARLDDRDHAAVADLIQQQARLDRPMTAECRTRGDRVIFTRDAPGGRLTLDLGRRRGGVRVSGAGS